MLNVHARLQLWMVLPHREAQSLCTCVSLESMPKGILHLFLICHALPVTPGDDEDFATRLADSCKLTDELGFIWHVLTALH